MKKYVLKLIKFMVKACLVEEREINQQVVLIIKDSDVTIVNNHDVNDLVSNELEAAGALRIEQVGEAAD